MGWQFEIFQTSVKGFRWKLRDPKGVLICMSDKSYPKYEVAEKEINNIKSTISGIKGIKIVDMDSPEEVKKRGGSKPSKKEMLPKDKITKREKDANDDT